MALKASKLVKADPKKVKAEKAKAKKPKDSEPGSVVQVDDTGLPGRKDLSSFVTGLKYKSKNPNDPSQTQAQKLLDHYHSLDDTDKRSLVKKYQEQGGIKNLNWTTKFFEESTCASSSTTGREQGYYNIAEIFQLNGFDYSKIEEKERKPMLEHFLKESSQCISPDGDHPAMHEVPGLPLLTKYLYCYYPDKVKIQETSTQSTGLGIALDGMDQNKVVKALGNTSQVEVKLENPHHAAQQDVLKFVIPMKTKLEKELHICQSYLKDLKVAKVVACKEAEKNIGEGLVKVENWMDGLRGAIHEGQLMGVSESEDNVKASHKKLEEYKSGGVVHQDGLKAVKARLLNLLKEFVKTGSS